MKVLATFKWLGSRGDGSIMVDGSGWENVSHREEYGSERVRWGEGESLAWLMGSENLHTADILEE